VATKTVNLSNTAYTKLDTGAATAIDFQNTSSTRIRVVMAASLPAPDETAFYYVNGYQGVSRDGKADDFYAMSDQALTATVTVGE
jgi:hypothetical protein